MVGNTRDCSLSAAAIVLIACGRAPDEPTITREQLAAVEGDDCKRGAAALELAIEHDYQVTHRLTGEATLADKLKTLHALDTEFDAICRAQTGAAATCMGKIVEYAEAMYDRDEREGKCLAPEIGKYNTPPECYGIQQFQADFEVRTEECRPAIEHVIKEARIRSQKTAPHP
jgi:hypothetical protein